MKRRYQRWFSRLILGVFFLSMITLGVFAIGNLHAKACEFELDEGIAWGQNGLYYMPAEVISEGDWQAFRGSNGMVYEWFGRVSETSEYLLTMDSKGTKKWFDDEILVIWRVQE